MTENSLPELRIFANGNVAQKWDAARRLMAAKKLISEAENPEIAAGISGLGEAAKTATGLTRLLAIDLIIRVSSLVRGLKPRAESILIEALTSPLPLAAQVLESKDLPPEAKPAEIRENVALALVHASGDWVTPYLVSALAAEDRSQRCRLELVRQLATREPNVDRWFADLASLPMSKILPPKNTLAAGTSRLKDISAAFAEVVRERRSALKASAAVGAQLARMCGALAPITPRTPLPPKLDQAVADVASLLDDLLTIRIDLITEPESYAPLEVFQRWYSPLPFPDRVTEAIRPLIDKLIGAIILRARMGQRSEGLSSRLSQATGNTEKFSLLLMSIAQNEPGLAPDIEDWLRGRVREASITTEALTRMLTGASVEELLAAIAPIILEATANEQPVQDQSDDTASLKRLTGQIKALASRLRLEVSGTIGDIVEFTPLNHRTLTGNLPREHRVSILRPMIIRRRPDGSIDTIEKALVADL